MIEVANVYDIRLNVIQNLCETKVHTPIPVAVTTPRIVDYVQGDLWTIGINLLMHGIIRRKGVLLTCEHFYVMTLSQTMTQRLRVDLRASIIAHWVSVDDLQNLHDRAAA
jgi:ABC-type siderophore export system fused ATPase/permease subunit